MTKVGEERSLFCRWCFVHWLYIYIGRICWRCDSRIEWSWSCRSRSDGGDFRDRVSSIFRPASQGCDLHEKDGVTLGVFDGGGAANAEGDGVGSGTGSVADLNHEKVGFAAAVLAVCCSCGGAEAWSGFANENPEDTWVGGAAANGLLLLKGFD